MNKKARALATLITGSLTVPLALGLLPSSALAATPSTFAIEAPRGIQEPVIGLFGGSDRIDSMSCFIAGGAGGPVRIKEFLKGPGPNKSTTYRAAIASPLKKGQTLACDAGVPTDELGQYNVVISGGSKESIAMKNMGAALFNGEGAPGEPASPEAITKKNDKALAGITKAYDQAVLQSSAGPGETEERKDENGQPLPKVQVDRTQAPATVTETVTAQPAPPPAGELVPPPPVAENPAPNKVVPATTSDVVDLGLEMLSTDQKVSPTDDQTKTMEEAPKENADASSSSESSSFVPTLMGFLALAILGGGGFLFWKRKQSKGDEDDDYEEESEDEMEDDVESEQGGYKDIAQDSNDFPSFDGSEGVSNEDLDMFSEGKPAKDVAQRKSSSYDDNEFDLEIDNDDSLEL